MLLVSYSFHSFLSHFCLFLHMFLTLVEWPSDVDIDDGTICMTSPAVMAMKSFDFKMFHTLVEGPCDVDNLTISPHD